MWPFNVVRNSREKKIIQAELEGLHGKIRPLLAPQNEILAIDNALNLDQAYNGLTDRCHWMPELKEEIAKDKQALIARSVAKANDELGRLKGSFQRYIETFKRVSELLQAQAAMLNSEPGKLWMYHNRNLLDGISSTEKFLRDKIAELDTWQKELTQLAQFVVETEKNISKVKTFGEMNSTIKSFRQRIEFLMDWYFPWPMVSFSSPDFSKADSLLKNIVDYNARLSLQHIWFGEAILKARNEILKENVLLSRQSIVLRATIAVQEDVSRKSSLFIGSFEKAFEMYQRREPLMMILREKERETLAFVSEMLEPGKFRLYGSAIVTFVVSYIANFLVKKGFKEDDQEMIRFICAEPDSPNKPVPKQESSTKSYFHTVSDSPPGGDGSWESYGSQGGSSSRGIMPIELYILKIQDIVNKGLKASDRIEPLVWNDNAEIGYVHVIWFYDADDMKIAETAYGPIWVTVHLGGKYTLLQGRQDQSRNSILEYFVITSKRIKTDPEVIVSKRSIYKQQKYYVLSLNKEITAKEYEKRLCEELQKAGIKYRVL